MKIDDKIDDMNAVGSPLITIEQSQPKIRTDEHIPIRIQEAEKLIDTGTQHIMHHNDRGSI